MQKEKKQFSLTLLMRVLLAVLVVVSVGVFANSVMRYNQLKEEERELEALLHALDEEVERLQELMGAGEDIEELLELYRAYREQEEIDDPELAASLEELEAMRAELDAMLQDSKNRAYIEQIARERCKLFYPDEEIIYNDRNQ